MTRTEFRKIFYRERAAFAEHFPYREWIGRARLKISDARCTVPKHCAFRDLGYCAPFESPPVVVMLSRALTFPRNNVVALIRHELGHVSDLKVGTKGSEQRADDIAETVTGVKIRYDARDVQTIGRGAYPRPKRLHR